MPALIIVLTVAVVATATVPSATASRTSWTAEPPFEFQGYVNCDDPCGVTTSSVPEDGQFNANALVGPSYGNSYAGFDSWISVDGILPREAETFEVLVQFRVDADLDAVAEEGDGAYSFFRYHLFAESQADCSGTCSAGMTEIAAEASDGSCFTCDPLPSSLHETRTVSINATRSADYPFHEGPVRVIFSFEAHASADSASDPGDGDGYWLEAEASDEGGSGGSATTPDAENVDQVSIDVTLQGSTTHIGPTDEPAPAPVSSTEAGFNIAVTVLEVSLRIPKTNHAVEIPPGKDKIQTYEFASPFDESATETTMTCVDASRCSPLEFDPATGRFQIAAATGTDAQDTADQARVRTEVASRLLGAAERITAIATIDLSSAHASNAAMIGDGRAWTSLELSIVADGCEPYNCMDYSSITLAEAGQGVCCDGGNHPPDAQPGVLVLTAELGGRRTIPPGNLTIFITLDGIAEVLLFDGPFMPLGLASSEVSADLTLQRLVLTVDPAPWPT
jgi:hypothetical protein